MTTNTKRGGPRKGAGRKPKSASGAVMRTHNMRWTDADWADALYIGADRVRELVRNEAARLRNHRAPNRSITES